MSILILQGPQLHLEQAAQIARETHSTLQRQTGYYRLYNQHTFSQQALSALRGAYNFDINLLPEDFCPAQTRLLVTDMDSTFINIECIDEIAAYAGKKEEVSGITAAAMRGEIDFETSLRQRVRLLAGVSTQALIEVYERRLTVNPGGEALLAGLKNRGIKVALVSGGFTYFTERLEQKYSLDYTLSNQLEIKNNQLTGTVVGNIVGASAKAKFLRTLCKKLAIKPQQAVAIGDGANDLAMLGMAGLGIAYHAKPNVQAKADIVLNHSNLDGILAFL
jgi:phosphoserine phosphatase